MRRAIILSIVLLVTLLVPFSRAACGCTQPPLTDSFQKNNVVVKATVTGNKSPSNGKRYYDVSVSYVYKGGCNYKTSDTFVVSTNSTADQCGVFLSVNTTYVLMGNADKVRTSGGKNTVYLSISKCQFRGRFNALNDYQKQHLLQLQAALPPCNPAKCKYNSDCDTTKQYCSNGTCRAHGTCGDVIDCVNPNNEAPVLECTGYLECTNGRCGRVCSASECPPSAPLQSCTPPCTFTTCLAGTTCVDYRCGQCHAYCFG